MILSKNIRFLVGNCFDIVAIGSKSLKVAQIASQFSNKNFNIKAIISRSTIVQPSLIPQKQAHFEITPKSDQFEISNEEIIKILPKQNTVVIRNGEKIHYKHLVYSGDDSQWKDLNQSPGLRSNHNVQGSFIYTDDKYTHIQELYKRRIGTIVFKIPKGRHFGYGNYFMMHLKAAMMRKQIPEYGDLNKIRMIVLNEGSSLNPFNTEHDQMLTELFIDSVIQYYNNTEFKIDYNNRVLYHRNQQINFDGLFQYLHFKVPDLLSNSNINPLENNMHTLKNNHFQNIYVIGNIFPTPFSLQSYDEISRVMAINIAYQLMGIKKQLIYQGTTACDIWLNQHQLKTVRFDYNSQGRMKLQRLGDNIYNNLAQGYLKKLFGRYKANHILNQTKLIQFFPERYFKTINTNPDQLPILINE